MSADIICVMPESNILGPELGQTEPEFAQAVAWSQVSSIFSIMDNNMLRILTSDVQMFSRPVAVIEARLMNTVGDVGKWRTISGLITQTKGIFSAAKSMATAFV